jgi:tRNA pseudouridine55 synthase
MKLSEGIYNVYKPKGPTSYDIIRKIKKLTDAKRIGHGGTLDPLASGVLIVAIGREFTKELDNVSRGEKEYEAVIKLGTTSSTGDEEGEKTTTEIKIIPSLKIVRGVVNSFQGKIKQTPPIYSAVKIKGQPAYKLARKGQEVKIREREVEIFSINLLDFNWSELKLRVSCSGGTYIRSLAEDIGKKLKTGGYLKDLIRTRVGDYKVSDSIRLD